MTPTTFLCCRRHCLSPLPMLSAAVPAVTVLLSLLSTTIVALRCRYHCRCSHGKTRTARYIPVRQLTGTRTGRYWAVPLRSTVDSRFSPSMVDFRRLRRRCPSTVAARAALAPSPPAGFFLPTQERVRGDVIFNIPGDTHCAYRPVLVPYRY
ncbi:hypothetical protein GW17_00050553 [Ensete ventricosum]|nr:hypothetical protein GW17_00050553 [Ensete ventricosum]